ncbi:MAG: hypothetical protein A2289_16200 [Deltaproteobacteria bacterium RIFOXYA12_FULL_58_15]|nr:MAG: hypothetical protein A2289_16200 [Deltaproteobacteria bacterium RIFOXYA12_FULL_58_15]
MASEVELLEAWRGGDLLAADELLRRHFDALYRFFRAKVNNHVEDLVQRTLLACVEGMDRIGEASFRSYLFGVARHKLMDHLRHHYRRGEEVDLLELSVRDLGTSPSRRIARRDGQSVLLAAMQTLPMDSQILLELVYWEGLSGKEIAAVLEIGENTVRSRLSRARVAVRAALEDAVGVDAAADLFAGRQT